MTDQPTPDTTPFSALRALLEAERGHHQRCAELSRVDEGRIAHSAMAAGLDIALRHLDEIQQQAGPAPAAEQCDPACSEQHTYTEGCVLEAAPDGDTCRPVEVDGEIIRVRGAREMTEQERGYLAEVIRAAKRKFAEEQQQEAVKPHGETRKPLANPANGLDSPASH